MKIGKSDASASEREPGRGGSGAPADIGEASCWRGKTTDFPRPNCRTATFQVSTVSFGLYLVYDSVCLFGRGRDGREPAAPLVTSLELRPLDETVERHRAYIDAASGDD